MEEIETEEVRTLKSKKKVRTIAGRTLFILGIIMTAMSLSALLGALVIGGMLSLLIMSIDFPGLGRIGLIILTLGSLLCIISGFVHGYTASAGRNMEKGTRRRFVGGMLIFITIIYLACFASSIIIIIRSVLSRGWLFFFFSLLFTTASGVFLFIFLHTRDTFLSPEEEVKMSSNISDRGYAIELEKEKKLMEEIDLTLKSVTRFESNHIKKS